MADLLDILKKEIKLKTKKIKLVKQLESGYDAYNKVIFEKRAFRDKNDKKLFTFKDSLNCLRELGYERHPRPNETFSLLCAYLEGDLSLEIIAKDMLNGYGEWLSLAMKIQNNILHCYIDPELELDRNTLHYHLKSYASEIHFSFSISDKCLFNIQELNTLNSEFVEFLWSRPFGKLPLQIRNTAYLYVCENLWPATRGSYKDRYDVNGCFCNYGASRGVCIK